MVLHVQDADGFEQAQRADRIGIGGIFRRLEAHMHMALRRQIIDLVGLGLLNQADQVGGVGQVAIVQEQARLVLVRVEIEVIDARRVER